tara:strand:- start:140 stop:496 length:357 start_codon:yes stop_codon:yes gene_type:complete
MKSIVMIALFSLISSTYALEFSLLPTSPIAIPDFQSEEEAMELFIETVTELRESQEVKDVVAQVEEGFKTTCTVHPRERKGFIWYKLPYKCTGESDFKLIVKAKFKGDSVVVKGFKVK